MTLTPRLLARACAPLAFCVLLASAAPVAPPSHFVQRNLVSDGSIPAAHVDPNLVNSWGLAFNPYGFAWVADADAGVSTLYDGNGNPQQLVVQIPGPPGEDEPGEATGIVFNGSENFRVSKGTVNGASRFIFATEQGVIAGWAPNVDVTHALIAVDNSATGANYKGLAISGGGSGQLIYAADFFHARVDVYDGSFQPASLPAGAFHDPGIPAGFAPFGIQAIGGDIYVTYARQDAAGADEVTGPGLGYVDLYTPTGRLIKRVASRGRLNAPWGVALAPPGFGRYANTLLIGNFGDGRINAWEGTFGFPMGPLRRTDGTPVRIDGLWGIAFGNGVAEQPVNTLFFASGPDDEEHGLYGRLDLIR